MRQFHTITLSYLPFHIITFQSSHVKSEWFWIRNHFLFLFLWQIFASVPPKKLPYNTPDHIKKILAIDLAKIFVIEDKVRHTLDTIGEWLTTKGSSSHSQFA
jgi:hypothetical protein